MCFLFLSTLALLHFWAVLLSFLCFPSHLFSGHLAHMEQKQKNQRGAARKMANKAKYTQAVDQINQISKDIGTYGMTPMNIVAEYKKNNATVLKSLSELQKQISPISQGLIARRALEKSNLGSVAKIREYLSSNGVDTKGIPKQVLEDLLALDDWSTIWAMAKPRIIRYGVPVLHDLWNRYVLPKIGLGGDEGMNSSDWAGNTTNPYRYTFTPGVNVSMPGINSAFTAMGVHDLVSTQSVKGLISPELSKSRYSYTETQRVALAVPSVEYSIYSNATGSVGMGIFIRNVLVTGASFNQSYLNIYNDATFSVNTGTQTPPCLNNQGPLYPSLSSMDSARHNVSAVTFLPTASLNTTGAFTLGYNNRYGSGATTTNIGVTLSQIKTWPYVTSFNNKTSARFVSLYGDSTDDTLINTSLAGYSQNHYMVLLGSGLPTSTEVGRLQIQSLVEFIPTVAAFPICPLDYPQTGPLTEQFESLMYQRWPVLQMLDLADAQRIVDGIPSEPVKYTELFKLMEPLVTGIKPRDYVSHSALSNLEFPGQGSFDFAIE